MGISFVGGAYNRAAGTRNAFDALSDELVSEGHPPMVSLSGDREPDVQERLWYERMTLAPENRRVYGYRWWEGRKWFQIHPDTVAPPRSSNHEARRSNDLKWPYNSNTAAARRAKVLARKHDITREGEAFGELWHWTFWGALGHIDNPSASGGSISPEEDEMSAEAERQIKALHDAVFRGGNSMKDNGASISDSLGRIAEATKPITIGGTQKSMRQVIADTRLSAARVEAQNAALTAAVQSLATAQGADPAAILRAVQNGVENAMRKVTFSADVDG